MSDAQAVRPLTSNTDQDPPETTSGETSFRDHQCEGYTCQHPVCAGEREHRVATFTSRTGQPRQPWQQAA